MVEERDCLIGLAPKYDAKETARQAAIEALQQHRFFDAMDCCRVYKALSDENPAEDNEVATVWWFNKERVGLKISFFNMKNAKRFVEHIGGGLVER